MSLALQWEARLRLYAEGDKLRAEGAKLYAEGAKLYAEGDKLRAERAKLRAEGAKLYAEGDKLSAEGAKLWAEAILETHGNIILEWVDKNDRTDCKLETGEYFRADALQDVAELL